MNNIQAINTLETVFWPGLFLINPLSLALLQYRAVEFAGRIETPVFNRIAGAGRHYPRKGATFKEDIELPGMTVENGVADIPIYGYIWDKIDPLAKWYFDATDMRDVQREVGIAAEDASIKAVVFSVDSPGGSARNVPETADMIAGIDKPTMAWVDGMAASAGYWLAANADMVYSTRMSDIGSIGVYSTFYDKTKMAEGFGIKVQVFASGKYKGMGIPGTRLTDDQAALIQADVDELAGQFKGVVRARRGDVSDDVMQGQTLSAPKAELARLIDGVMQSKEQAIANSNLR